MSQLSASGAMTHVTFIHGPHLEPTSHLHRLFYLKLARRLTSYYLKISIIHMKLSKDVSQSLALPLLLCHSMIPIVTRSFSMTVFCYFLETALLLGNPLSTISVQQFWKVIIDSLRSGQILINSNWNYFVNLLMDGGS